MNLSIHTALFTHHHELSFALFFAVSMLSFIFSSCVGEIPLQDSSIFSLASGKYGSPQSVTIITTDDSTIYYTTDGSDPTSSSTPYTPSAPIEVRKVSTTLKAVSIKDGIPNSKIYEAAYIITDPTYYLLETGPAGGLIFYENSSYKEDGWKYLESALAGWNGTETADPLSRWGSNGEGTTGYIIGTGKSNTNEIVELNESYNAAAKLCADHSITKAGVLYDDWFLPSRDELYQMYSVLHKQPTPLGDFIDETYWSSTESFEKYAMIQSFHNGRKYNSGRTTRNNWVRPIRAF